MSLTLEAFGALMLFVSVAVGRGFAALDGFVVMGSVTVLDFLVGFAALYLFVDFLVLLDIVGSDR